ncbi:Protein of unknown function DUF1752, fungi [Ceraceosorus bombacis]|uniref:Nitrogen regulatory protein areA GATA-like domain-containing protein n=1 Tax=Ceraceosorus bombacis TaxID=401625 RepID=A0A0P1BBZ7_9BASI|nr:Protein of unknown function DUF1752, fungi [Ceraceosorus bombacis]
MMSAPAPYPAVASHAPAPDDHEISKKTPSICVDYLSHNWTDEDVWSSWKAMTKRKNEIANGVRLENASWRTWAKQRGKLKTISPETLNWLKDSDVTWLYGPLHEHADPVPPPRVATAGERLGLDDDPRRRKSILKHRTISEMLTTPGRSANENALPLSAEVSHETSEDETETESSTPRRKGISSLDASPRPKPEPLPGQAATLDSGLPTIRKNLGGSPPPSVRLTNQPALDRADSAASSIAPEEKRHISFNQRVEQCISVDVEEIEYDDEEEEEDEEEDDEDDTYNASKAALQAQSTQSSRPDGREGDTEEGSEDDVLTMRSSPRHSPSWPLTSTSGASSRVSSPGAEHHTIAKLAPTMLKTSDTFPLPSAPVVDPSGFGDSFKASSSSRVSATGGNSYSGYGDDEDAGTRYSQWDADDDFGEYDYFDGPDVNEGYTGAAGGSNSDASPSPPTSHEDPEATVRRMAAAIAAKNGGQTVKHASPPEEMPPGTSAPASAPPARRSILKKGGPGGQAVSDEHQREEVSAEASAEANDGDYFGTSPVKLPADEAIDDLSDPKNAAPASRGRSSQRLGTSASYERIQDAARGGSSSRTRTNSNNSSSSNASTSPDDRFANSHRSGERRDSFRGRAGDGSRAMDKSGSYAAAAARIAGHDGEDSDGRASLDFASPGFPASPQLGDGENERAEEGKMYGRTAGGDSSVWSDGKPTGSRSSPSKSKSAAHRRNPSDDGDNPRGPDGERLSLDVEHLPSNDPNLSPPSALGGPTPLNTPTLALARSRGGAPASRKAGSSETQPSSPTVPRRSSATGAIVAPSDADRQAGVRVPLSSDYVEEDEGGIVGRAVEMVNTARDLIGALWGGDRGASWRQS